MGQRTLTFVTYINKQGAQQNKFYYNSWGIGRVQLNAIMGNFMCLLGAPGYNLDQSFDMIDQTDKINTETDEYRLPEGTTIDHLNFGSINDCRLLLRQADNNNGAVTFIWDDQNECGYIGFILGPEEAHVLNEEPYNRFVPFDTWAKYIGLDFVDESYKNMFHFFCTHFNITILSGDLERDIIPVKRYDVTHLDNQELHELARNYQKCMAKCGIETIEPTPDRVKAIYKGKTFVLSDFHCNKYRTEYRY